MPAVDRLFDSDFKPRIPIEHDNLYLATFNGLASYQINGLDDAAKFVNFSQGWFRKLINMAVFRHGGVISGGMAYWYPTRFPRHEKFEKRVQEVRYPVEQTILQHRGWAPKVVMLVRTTFPVSSKQLRSYIVQALGWVRSYTSEQRAADMQLDRIMRDQDVGNIRPPGEPGLFQCQIRVRRVTALEDGIVRYGTGRLSPLIGVKRRNSRSRVRKTETSFGTRVFRNLRLSLLECAPKEGAMLLTVLCSQTTIRKQNQYSGSSGKCVLPDQTSRSIGFGA